MTTWKGQFIKWCTLTRPVVFYSSYYHYYYYVCTLLQENQNLTKCSCRYYNHKRRCSNRHDSTHWPMNSYWNTQSSAHIIFWITCIQFVFYFGVLRSWGVLVISSYKSHTHTQTSSEIWFAFYVVKVRLERIAARNLALNLHSYPSPSYIYVTNCLLYTMDPLCNFSIWSLRFCP